MPRRRIGSGKTRHKKSAESPRFFVGVNALLCVDDLLQFPAFIHLHHDVGAADEFAFDVQLGDGGPVAVFLDARADFWVFEDVHRGDAFGVYADGFEDLNRSTGEAALGKVGVAFHEKHNIVAFDEAVYPVVGRGLGVAHGDSFLALNKFRCVALSQMNRASVLRG